MNDASDSQDPPFQSVRRLLIVDDDADVAEAIAEVLAHPLVSISVAPNGIDALALARTLRPHVMLLDVALPAIDGFEVFRLLRHELGASCKTIFLTALATTGALALAKDYGAHACIRKPFANVELRARVLDALGIADEHPRSPVKAPDSRAPSGRHPPT